MPADCSLFRLIDRQMTTELRRSGHDHPEGSLLPSNVRRARATFAHQDLFVVGMIVIRYHAASKLAKFYRLWVEPAARKSGIGRALMNVAERHVVKRGGRIIEFDTGLDLAPAVALYRSLGYDETPLPELNQNSLLFRKSLVQR